jgi:uncharacterized membrane protein YjgN (DUF898 family)
VNPNAYKLSYHGTGDSLFGLVLKNAVLTILTLGIYSFWAKNAVRQFHYSHTEIDGDRFAYHGTGGELLRGALKAFGILFVLTFLLGLVTFVLGGDETSPATNALISVAFYPIIGALVIVAIHGARRYRLSRSSFRGIRFSFHGDLGEFFGMMVRGTLLSILTLGFYLPYFASQRRVFLANNVLFGTEPFLYDGEGQDLFGAYLKAVLLTIPTLGLCWIWYKAFEHRYFWDHTAMRDARFSSTVTGGEMFRLYGVNLLLVLFTFGLGTPWAVTRTHTYFARNMVLFGTVDWARIQQRVQTATATGEGLAEGLDIDVGIGM